MTGKDQQIAAEQRERWLGILKGDLGAVQFVNDIGFISHVWDDLVDGDSPTVDNVNKAFWLALVGLKENPFYQRHRAELVPLMRSYINCWLDSNIMERGNDHAKSVAFVLRDMVSDIVCQCAYLVGGYDWMRQVSPQIREVVFDEPLNNFLEERA
ncbi:hypothetical protein SYK_02940 [Pseudodesulfovibrio nedwellii]|uniref:Uncharacterized protein n=1 Tax=Pseudodesulfovibrio nedwellii TaxID=2973072 RepID=A0ABM8AWT8_9BACT|nr:hypothetical protein [Pseudodesulfovibrio nedwellii]BDQ35934.1 hypothetical protein SYK_02940 [Pseudodesulfovibrio nedwellii]